MLMAPDEKHEDSMLPSVLQDTSKVSPMPRTSLICKHHNTSHHENMSIAKQYNAQQERTVTITVVVTAAITAR